MSLKLFENLFTGPFDLNEFKFRKNKKPTILLIIEKEGPDYDPKFRLIDFYITKNEDFKPQIKKYKNKNRENLSVFFKEFDKNMLNKRKELYSLIKERFNKQKIFLDY